MQILTFFWVSSFDAMSAPASSKLLRQLHKFPADWLTSGIFATSFARLVFRKNVVIDSIAYKEDSYQYKV